MSDEDREKWNRRYAEDSYNKRNPVTLLEDWLPRLPVGKALDVACGAGRNALALARAGFTVDAIDISVEGLQQARAAAAAEGLEITFIEHDLDDPYPFAGDYDLILVLWYVDLALIRRLSGCLAPGGYLISEEHLETDEDVIGPQSAAFRVAPGALRDAVAGLEILHHAESVETATDGARVASAQVVARRAD